MYSSIIGTAGSDFSAPISRGASFFRSLLFGSHASIVPELISSPPQEMEIVPPTPGVTVASSTNQRVSSSPSEIAFHTASIGASITISCVCCRVPPRPDWDD